MKFQEENFLNIYPEFEEFVNKNVKVTDDIDIANKCVELTSKFIVLIIKHNELKKL